jgi:hypothetical protein
VKRAVQASLLCFVLTTIPLARAQSDAGLDAPDARDPFRQLVDSDPFAGDDPVGAPGSPEGIDPIAAEGTADLRSAPLPSEDELVGERLPIVRGEVLEAVAGLREVEHRVAIELSGGLALVRTELRFESSARYAAELSYRLAVPRDAVPFALEVCSASGSCRAGRLETGEGRLSAYDAAILGTGPLVPELAPIAVVERVEDARGQALRLRAAPVPPAGRSAESGSSVPGALVVRVSYSVPLAVHGGVARLALPARGSDVRAAPARVGVRAIDLVVPRLDGIEVEGDARVERSAAVATTLDARVPRTWSTRGEVFTAPCGRERCVWARAMAERPSLDVRDVVLAIDASPSTAAGARGLLPEAALAILGQLPASARVRVVAFAARAEVLVPEPVAPTAIDDALLQRATETELGSATRFEALWAALEPWSRSRGLRVIWLGDGGLTSSDEGRRAVEAARSRGISLHVVSVADRSPVAALAELARALDAPLVEAHPEALLASRSGSREPLADHLASVLVGAAAREVVVSGLAGGPARGSLAPGGSVGIAGRTSGRASMTLGGARAEATAATGDLALAIAARGSAATRFVAAEASAEASRCAEGAQALHPSAALARVTALPNRFARVERRSCAAPAPTAEAVAGRRSGLSAAALLRTLRRRMIPRARDCFRSDRRGRAGYSTHVSLTLTLADREIVDVRAEGAIEPTLRACLVDAADAIDVPAFDGVVVARWPLYSRPDLPPPTLELHPDLASAVDAIGREDAAPR